MEQKNAKDIKLISEINKGLSDVSEEAKIPEIL